LTTPTDFVIVFIVVNTTPITDQRQQVLDLHTEGKTPREIAKELDLSVQRIYQQLKKLGLEPNQQNGQQ
jgi:DNA-binding NarL/FixJ family response regulator